MHQPQLNLEQYENQLRSLNSSYKAMLDLLAMFETSQTTFTEDQFTERLADITGLQVQIETQEFQLQGRDAEGLGKSPVIAILLEEKKALIEALIKRNQSVVLQARAVQSYLRDALHQASAGYVALKGYRSSEPERGSGFISKSI